MTDKTVADDPKPAPQETVTDPGAQDKDLDTVLSEIDQDFDKDTKVPGSKTEPKETDDIAEVRQTVDYLLNQMESGDIEKAVDTVSKSLEVQVPKRAIRGMLNDMAIEDPRIRKAFQNRLKDPSGWNKVLKAATRRIGDEFKGIPDKQLTDDREALAATIRGASKTSIQDDAPNFKKMSDQEFDTWKRNNY